MYKVSCFCGKRTKNFKHEIEAYFDDCCKEEGFNDFGEKEGDQEPPQEPDQEPDQEPEQTEEPPKVDGDIDKDGDVDAQDVKLAVDYEKMGQKELMEECDKRKIEYRKNESKKELRAKLKA